MLDIDSQTSNAVKEKHCDLNLLISPDIDHAVNTETFSWGQGIIQRVHLLGEATHRPVKGYNIGKLHSWSGPILAFKQAIKKAFTTHCHLQHLRSHFLSMGAA